MPTPAPAPTPALDNLIGAFALLVNDEVVARLTRATGLHPSSQAALLCIDMYPACSINQLRTALALSHAAAVRCVAALVAAGWVLKSQAQDKRSVALELSAEGRRMQRRLLGDRGKALRGFSAALTAGEQRTFEGLLRKLLWAATRDEPHAMQVCRMCDCGPCLEENCPVEQKAQGLPA